MSLMTRLVLEHEGAEHDDHDRRGGGDDAGGGGEAVGDRAFVLSLGAVVLLLHPREQEHLVVHREPEHDREHHHRDERLDRAPACRCRRASRASPHWKIATTTP